MRLLTILAVVCSIAFAGHSFAASNPSGDWASMEAQFHGSGSYLGVRLADIDADRASSLNLGDARGVEVVGVEPNSPAERAGIKSGDVLLSYNGENILGAQQLGRLVSETPPDRKIKVQYWRAGNTETTTVLTATRPAGFFEFPSGVNPQGLNLPDMRSFRTTDVPMPFLVWKVSPFGIECEQLSPQLGEYFGVKDGALVRSVEKGSPAERAGIKAGDVITSLGSRRVTAPRDITSFTRSRLESMKDVSVGLIRKHQPIKVTLTVPEDRQ